MKRTTPTEASSPFQGLRFAGVGEAIHGGRLSPSRSGW